jgi:hypothetical protein
MQAALERKEGRRVWNTAQHSTAQHSTAQHSTAQHSTAHSEGLELNATN